MIHQVSSSAPNKSEQVASALAGLTITKEPISSNSPNSHDSSNLNDAVFPNPVITENGQIFTVIGSSAIVFNGITISTKATISGTVYSINSAGELVINNGNAHSTLSEALNTVPSIITIDGLAITKESNHFIAGGSTLKPGGSSVTVSGTPISLGTSGVLVIGTHSVNIPQITPPPTLISSTLTVNGLKITENPDQVIVGGLTLTPGAPAVVISGKSISLDSLGVLVVGNSTVVLPKYTSPAISTQGSATVELYNPSENSGVLNKPYLIISWNLLFWILLGIRVMG